MRQIGIGIIGGGYMGKAHAVAMAAVGAVFSPALRPRLEMVAATSEESAARYREAYGFARSTADWRALVDDPKVEAVIIASPQDTHRAITEAAFAAGKHVLCEKPLAENLDGAIAMQRQAAASGLTAMCGYNYIRTPATQYALDLVRRGELGQITGFRGEHTEDFLSDPAAPANWRTSGRANGTLGDLAPHMVHCALAFMGPPERVMADIATVHATRPGPDGTPAPVTNDDALTMLMRFPGGVMGSVHASRVATGRKMGYAYEVTGTKGALRFDQEDQNALWLYRAAGPEAERGFTKVLAGPAHPDYLPFCQGPGHGTGYQDQIIIEAYHFLTAIAEGRAAEPSFADGLQVARICEAAWQSSQSGAWVALSDIAGKEETAA